MNNNEINTNEAEIDLGKNNESNNSNFNKFFEEQNEEIIVQTFEQADEAEGDIDDDTIYEIDVYNSLISGKSITEQNNPKRQEEILKLSRHLINLKNKSKTTDLGDIEDYPDMKKIYKNEFNSSWIIPITLDKKKIYKKLEIQSNLNDEVIDSYMNTASNKGIQYEDFQNELKKEIKYIDEFNRDKLSFKTYRKLIYDIEQPYLIKKEIKKKDVGYNLYLNQYTELLRYFNIDNKFWQTYINNGPERFSYEQYDENGKRIGSKESQILAGAYTNIIGLLVLGSKEENILDLLNGKPWFDRIRMIGEATKIYKNEDAIIELKKHGLKDGDKVMILKSNSEPSIDGEYKVKIINENQFMVPVDTSDGKEGTSCEVYSTTLLNFKRVELDKKILEINSKEDYSEKYFDNALLYLFPEEEINEEEWKQICKKIIPKAGAIIETQKIFLEKANTIDEIDLILKRFSLDFRNLGWDDYFIITEILDEKYIKERDINVKFNADEYYAKIMSKRQKLIGEKDENKVENDIVFGNKYIFNKDVVKYYGTYPNAGTDVDSIVSRYNWVLGTPDYGHYYYLMIELDKIKKEYEDVSVKDIEALIKKINGEINELEKEGKKVKDEKNCVKRELEGSKIRRRVKSYNELFNDKGKEMDFLIGDYAIIENPNSHEDGQIYVWNGSNWTQNILIKSIKDLCLLGVEQIKELDLSKLYCLFKEGCKNKKKVRIENRIEKLKYELSILENLTKESTRDIEKKIGEKLKIAELNLQIYVREFEDTRQKETIELYEGDYDQIYLDILKIPDMDTREYLRNLLIKKDGILIDKDIYSIRTGKKICCGHYYYHLKIAEGGSPEYSEKMTNDMLAIFGTEEENGMIFCSHDGKPLMLMDFDTAEGLSKTTGEVDRQREVVLDEEEELREKIEALQEAEREAEIFDCSGPEIRTELLRTGFAMEQVSKAKDVCGKLNAINSKTGIILKRSEFIGVIIDVMQVLQKLPDFARFKLQEIVDLKKRGVDFKKIDSKIFAERYNDFVTIRKVSTIASRLLITYQTLIPPQYPTGKKSGVIFEGFEGGSGLEYLALLVEEAKLIPLHKRTKNGKEVIIYLPLGKIKEEIRRAYDELMDLATVKKLKKDKRLYEARQISQEEERAGIVVKEVPKVGKLEKGFQLEVEKAKKYVEFSRLENELRGRENYISYEIIKAVNESIAKATDRQSDDPKSIELSCCFQEVNEKLDYYRYISERTNEGIYDLLDESRRIAHYDALFLHSGVMMKHYPRRDANFHLRIRNFGYNNDGIRKSLFVTYIDKGIFRGEKHEFNDEGICLITGELLQDVLKREYSDKEENELIKFIIGKTVKKIVLGGSEEDERLMRERDESLLEGLDLGRMKEESVKSLGRDIGGFVERMGKLLNRSSNKDFMNSLRERIDNLGLYSRVNDLEREMAEASGNARRIVELENEINRMRIFNLKRYINNYFRRYISMIANMHDPTEHIKQLLDVEEDTSRELQKFIYDRDYFLKKYMTRRDSDLFKKLNFSVSAKVISNISAGVDVWDKTYTKIEKIENFNLSNLCDVLVYILVENLNNFITMEFDKGVERNKMVAQFINEVFEKIGEDDDRLDFTPDTFMEGDYRAKEHVADVEVEVKKDETSRLLAEFDYKFKRVRDEEDYGEVYDNLEGEERMDALKLKFIKDYKDKFEKDPTDNEVIDYLEELEKEDEKDKREEEQEWMGSKINEEGDDVLEIGDGYGEMPQGGEGEDGDY